MATRWRNGPRGPSRRVAAVYAHAHPDVLAVLGAASDQLPDSAEYAALAAAWASVLESVSVDQVVGLGGPGDDREQLARVGQ